MFSKHHYLSHSHNNAAKVYLAAINGVIAGFCSVLHFPHPKVKNLKRIHRLVVLPDYQGAGIGIRLLNEVANLYKKEKQRVSIVTSSPALIFGLKKRNNWACKFIGRQSGGTNSSQVHGKGRNSTARITATFEII